MPELAEVEVVRRNMADWWTRPASDVLLHDEKLLTRGTLEDLTAVLESAVPTMDRRGKYLIARFPDRRAIVFHFRMSGKIVKCPEPDPRFARLAWNATEGGWLVYKDSRRLGHVDVLGPGEIEAYDPLVRMGPEPQDVDADLLKSRLSPRRRLKDALMDQSVVAGVGNIAISEIFWRLRLRPDIGVRELHDEQMRELASEIPKYFDEIIDAQLADEIVYIGEGNDEENPFDVYGREGEPCPRCGTAIQRQTIGGRSSYYCPKCQR